MCMCLLTDAALSRQFYINNELGINKSIRDAHLPSAFGFYMPLSLYIRLVLWSCVFAMMLGLNAHKKHTQQVDEPQTRFEAKTR